MKAVTIIFCILTIIMLTALSISILNNDDKTTSNKEKRYILLYILSFIFLMISSILSTLEINIIAIIVFIIFLVSILLATINYFSFKKALNNKSKKIIPNKLKNKLTILKEDRDGYTYKVKTNLICCDSNDFKIKAIKNNDLTIIHCICNKCNNEYEVFNSELDGYNLEVNNEIKIIKEESKEHKCKCKKSSYKVEIDYEYIDSIEDIKELKKLGINDLTNIYTSIKINLTCNNCNKKEKDYIKHEFK